MTTTSSDLALTVTATDRGAGKEAFAHLSRGESLAMIPPLILELSGRISRRAALLEASSIDPAQNSDDLAALAWIQRSLEDVEATIIGLSESQRSRSAASQNFPLLLPETWFPRFRRARPPGFRPRLTMPAGYRSSLRCHGHLACPTYRSPP